MKSECAGPERRKGRFGLKFQKSYRNSLFSFLRICLCRRRRLLFPVVLNVMLYYFKGFIFIPSFFAINMYSAQSTQPQNVLLKLSYR